MKNNTTLIWVFILTVFVFMVGFAGGIFADRVAFANVWPIPVTSQPGSQPDFRILREAWKTIDQNYVDRQAIQQQKLEYGAVSGMVEALGDTGHSRFLSPEMVKVERSMTQGWFEGIGAEVQEKDGQIVIVSPIDGSPAQKAGLNPGDVILKVNGKDVTGQPLSEVVSQIVGPAGSQVTLTILHPETGRADDLTLTRAKIQYQNIGWSQIPGTNLADIRIAAFSNNVTNDLKQALQEIEKQGLKGAVIDLRNNPGGLLDELVNTASQFLSSGAVLQVKDAEGKVQDIPVKKGGVATDLPVVILINQGTASAAEIVSGALQDAGRAKLVGEKTFGTGTVLNQFSLSDGSALLLATQEWLTPKGRLIWHQGIEPDVTVSMAPDILPVSPNALKTMSADALKNIPDAQFLKALELLRSSQ